MASRYKIKSELGNLIRAHPLFQYQIAPHMGITDSLLSDIHSGQKFPQEPLCHTIAGFFGRESWELFKPFEADRFRVIKLPPKLKRRDPVTPVKKKPSQVEFDFKPKEVKQQGNTGDLYDI